jgi:xylulokinase
MGAIHLGADIGTSSAKCLAVNEDGEVLALAQHAYALTHPRENWVEQDAEDYWQGLVDAVGQCIAECGHKGHRADEIASLALSTQGDTLIVTDDAGEPLAPAFSWMDRRAEGQRRELLAETGPAFWYRSNGRNLSATSSACKIRWIEQNAPEVAGRIRRYCWVPDFLAWRLCGEFVMDTPSASWTPFFSPFVRRWSPEVTGLLGVPRQALPTVVESGTAIGHLLPDAAAALGLAPHTMLVAGAFDQAAAAHGAGAKAGLTSVLSCGTAWVLYAVLDEPTPDDREQIPVCCHTNAIEWAMVLPFTGGAAYDWFQNTFQPGATSESGKADPPIFIPHLYGGLAPDWHEESRGSLLGLTMAHTWEDVRLAVMRGLACEARRNVDAAERLSGRISSVRLVGGAGKSDVWPQLIADVLARPVAVSHITESACYGAAKLAAGSVAAQWYEAGAAREFEPRVGQVEIEQRLYERHVRFYEALLPPYGGPEEQVQ